MREIPKRDWKILRSLKDQLLQQFCERILLKIKPIIDNRENDSYQAYLKLYKTIIEEDKTLGYLFDDLRRSTAFSVLAAWRRYDLLSDDNYNRLTEETRRVINNYNSL